MYHFTFTKEAVEALKGEKDLGFEISQDNMFTVKDSNGEVLLTGLSYAPRLTLEHCTYQISEDPLHDVANEYCKSLELVDEIAPNKSTKLIYRCNDHKIVSNIISYYAGIPVDMNQNNVLGLLRSYSMRTKNEPIGVFNALTGLFDTYFVKERKIDLVMSKDATATIGMCVDDGLYVEITVVIENE